MLLRVSIPPQWKPFPIRGGLIPGYELLLRGCSLLGPLGGSFFFVSCPATHLHHLRHHLDAVESVTGFFRLHHFPHHVRKRRPFEKARKFFWGILLILNHFDFPPFLGGSWPPASLAFSTYKTKVPEERLHFCGRGEITAQGRTVRGISAAWFCGNRLTPDNLPALSPLRPPTAKRPYKWSGHTGGSYSWAGA